MGQINCGCKQQQMEQQVQYCQVKSGRKIVSRVRTILQPKQINNQFKPYKYSQLLQKKQYYSSQFCKILLLGHFFKIQLEIKRKPITLGTQLSEISMPSHSPADKYKMLIKYQNRAIMIKDTGFGLGVFLRAQQTTLKDQLLINKGKQFIHLQIRNNIIQWKYWSQNTQLVGLQNVEHKNIKGFLIERKKNKQYSIKYENNDPFWIYCNEFIELQQGSIIRCGESFYRVSQVQQYINSSRLICKY